MPGQISQPPNLHFEVHCPLEVIKNRDLNMTHFGGTLPKTNIAPENRPSQKETHLPTIHFQVLC